MTATVPPPVASHADQAGVGASSGWAERVLARRWPVSVAFVGVLLGAWQLAGALDRLPEYILSPWSIGGEVVELTSSGDLWDLLFPSLRRAMTGFAIGAGAGVVLGLLAGVVRTAGDLLELPVAFTNPLPKVALFPSLAVWLGSLDNTRVLVIALAVFYPCYIDAHAGARGIDARLVWIARNAGAGRLRTFRQVVVPAALPRIMAGLRIGLALSFVLLFATEIIGFSDGLGAHIYESYQDGVYGPMYAGIAVLGFCGFLANAGLVALTNVLTYGQRLRAVSGG